MHSTSLDLLRQKMCLCSSSKTVFGTVWKLFPKRSIARNQFAALLRRGSSHDSLMPFHSHCVVAHSSSKTLGTCLILMATSWVAMKKITGIQCMRDHLPLSDGSPSIRKYLNCYRLIMERNLVETPVLLFSEILPPVPTNEMHEDTIAAVVTGMGMASNKRESGCDDACATGC